MTPIVEGELSFTFPDDWSVSRPDKWSFYRNNPANVLQRLRRLIRFVDPHPLVVDCSHNVEWLVK